MASARSQVTFRVARRQSQNANQRRRDPVAHLLQVGAGSGGMPVLDMLCRDPRITRVTLIEPDVYKPHNVERHLFPQGAVGQSKAVLAREWIKERRPEVEMHLIVGDLLDPALQR